MALKYSFRKSEFLKGLESVLKPMQFAAHKAVTEAGKLAVLYSRKHVLGKGFNSSKWRGFRSRVTPKKKSIDVEALITHRLGYAGIFEEGGTIKGKPLLWLPITANLPTRFTSPRKFVRSGRKLASARGSKPLLVGEIGGQIKPVFHGVQSAAPGTPRLAAASPLANSS